MAEKADYFTDNSSFVQGGLNTDDSPLFIAEGDWTYALNAWLTNNEGTCSFMNNYPSNEVCVTLKDNYIIIGSKRLADGRVVIFSTDNTSSEIGILSKGCSYNTLVNDECINFNSLYPAQIEFTERFDCGVTIYWTDNRNPRRYLAIDDFDLSTFTCNDLLVQPIITYPCVSYYTISEVGELYTGMYKPFIQYSDVSGIAQSDWYESIGNIPIYKDFITSNFDDIQGGYVNEVTNKAIKFEFSNIDTNFDYINIGILATIGGVKTSYMIATVPTTTATYLFTGTEDQTTITLGELLIDSINYAKAKTVTQANGYLLWGNLNEVKDPDFQTYANDIQVEWQTFKVPSVNTAVNSKSPYTTTFKKGFMRDEVYPIGIRLIYSTGLKSCTYHIPGRKLDTYPTGTPIPITGTDQYGQVLTVGWDSSPIPDSNTDNLLGVQAERYKIYNTAGSTGFSPDYIDPTIDPAGAWSGSCAEKGFMAYWESGIKYPDTQYENGTYIYPRNAANTDMAYIRHHKMPDCSVTRLFDNIAAPDPTYGWVYLNYLGINVNNIVIPNTSEYADVVGWEIVVGDRTGQKSIIAKGLLYNTLRINVNHPERFDAGPSSNHSEYDDRWHMIISSNAYTNYEFNAQTGMYNDNNASKAIGYKFMDKDDHKKFSPVINTVIPNFDQFTFFSPDTHFNKPNLAVQELRVEREFSGNWSQLQRTHTALTADTFLGIYYNSSQAQYQNINRVLEPNTALYLDTNTSTTPPAFAGKISNCKNESNVWLQLQELLMPCTTLDDSFSNITSPGIPIGTDCAFYTPDTLNVYDPDNLERILCPDVNTVLIAGNMANNNEYYINTIGTTDFTLYGAASNTVGLPFTKTGSTASGTGTVFGTINEASDNCGNHLGDISSYYGSLKLYQPNQYQQVDTITYTSTGTCPIDKAETSISCLFGGDTFLSNYTYHRSRKYETPLPEWNFYDNYLTYSWGPNTGDCPEAEYPTSAVAVNSAWVESSINTELRVQGTGVVSYDQFYPYNGLAAQTGFDNSWGTGKWAYAILDIGQGHSTINDNIIFYNFDYSSLNKGKDICVQLIDPIKQCETHLKTRVIISGRQQQENLTDFWLKYAPADYYDFPKESGELWDMRSVEQDRILFRFTNGIYQHMAYETMETSLNTVELGTGAIFAKEPKKLVSTDTGYAGTQSQFAFNSTEFGHFMIDAERGTVFKFEKGLNPISTIKCFNFFSKELPLKLTKSFPDYPYIDNTADPRGIGFASIYDPKYKIWLLTKKDYKPIVEGIVWTGTNFSYRSATGDVEPELTDPTYFCEQSYTIGYDCLRNRWISFYSFIPDSYIQDTYSYKSAKGNKIYTHNIEGSYCIYFDEPYDHIVELPFKFKGQITNKTSIQFLTESFEYVDGDPYSHEYSTFNRAIVYNNEQNTGYLDLIVPDNTNLSTILNQTVVNASSITIPVQKAGKQIWKFSDLWDRIANRTVANPMFVKSCTPSVDKELNQACINYQKSWYDLKRISSPWAKCRLFFSDTDKNLITQIGTSKEKIDIF